jgi:hypothetical protein
LVVLYGLTFNRRIFFYEKDMNFSEKEMKKKKLEFINLINTPEDNFLQISLNKSSKTLNETKEILLKNKKSNLLEIETIDLLITYISKNLQQLPKKRKNFLIFISEMNEILKKELISFVEFFFEKMSSKNQKIEKKKKKEENNQLIFKPINNRELKGEQSGLKEISNLLCEKYDNVDYGKLFSFNY